MIFNVVVFVVFFGLALYSIIGLFSLLKVLVGVHRYDELERKAILDALSVSMLTILIVNLLQLVLSFNLPHRMERSCIPWWVLQRRISK